MTNIFKMTSITVISRSHALCGNVVTDAPRRIPALLPITRETDAERPRKGYHVERGNQDNQEGRTGDAPAGRRYDMFIVLNVFMPIYPVKRGFLEIHVIGFTACKFSKAFPRRIVLSVPVF
jgi:hypothetical protein